MGVAAWPSTTDDSVETTPLEGAGGDVGCPSTSEPPGVAAFAARTLLGQGHALLPCRPSSTGRAVDPKLAEART